MGERAPGNDITISVNGQGVAVRPGASVLDAVNLSGTYLSQLCKDPDMKPIGACRTCLVKVDGVRGFPASCSLPARDGMKVMTEAPDLERVRSGVIELTLAMLDGDGADDGIDRGELSVAARHHGVAGSRWNGRSRGETDTSNPVFDIAMNDCILCGRCTRACQDGHQFIGAIDFLGAGAESSRIGTFMDRELTASVCTTCGQCLSVCPTGAIRTKEAVESVARTVTTTCPYCGVGCGIRAKVDGAGAIAEVADDPDNRSSLGMLCVKGRFGYTFVNDRSRLTAPLVRRNGVLTPATWDEALDLVADRLSGYAGAEFGTLCSAKATNEDGYVQQKFARLIMQSNNIDHCTRLCHSPSVKAMQVALGNEATSNSYADYEDAGCLMIVGSDADSNHPVAAARMRRGIVERGAKLIVVNPRRIGMCDYAEVWLRPQPGTDVALFNAMANVILSEGLADGEFIRSRTEGFDEWRSVVERYDASYAEKITGVPAADIAAAARTYAAPPFSGSCLIWGMGITQHTNGTPNVHGLLNLALATGQLGKPGAGVSPLRGQNNVQGCGDAGCLPDAFPGYQKVESDAHGRFQAAWGGHPIPAQAGMVVTEMADEMLAGRLKAMYVTGENPLLSEPDLSHAQRAFESLEFLVVQDIFMHETAEIADVVLPASSFAEKDGTFTNSERRVQRVRRAVEPVGGSRPDWEIICDLARRMARGRDPGLMDQFSYSHPSQIWDEMASLVPNLGGISYGRLDREGGLQYPCPTADHPGTRFLYGDGFPGGRLGRFVAFEQGPEAREMPSRRFPLILNTGRILYHWHGGTMTRRAPALLARAPDVTVSMSALDADRYGLKEGEWARLTSRRGSLDARVLLDERMEEGQVFVPFTKLKESAANFLTNSALDPNSKIPEYKVCAVRVHALNGN